MAFTEYDLGSGSISSTTLTSIYTVGTGRTASIYSLWLTNTTGNVITVSAYINNGTSDLLQQAVKIPAGSGKAVSVDPLFGATLSASDAVKLQSGSADSFNYKLNGSER